MYTDPDPYQDPDPLEPRHGVAAAARRGVNESRGGGRQAEGGEGGCRDGSAALLRLRRTHTDAPRDSEPADRRGHGDGDQATGGGSAGGEEGEGRTAGEGAQGAQGGAAGHDKIR